MKLTRTISVLTAGVITIAAILGVAAYRTVSAQEATPAAPSPTAPDRGLFGGPRGGLHGGYTQEDLANALGVTVDELNTAYENASDAALDQAVQAGLITQAQADEIRSSGSAFPFGGRWSGWLSQNGIDYDALLANALGITVEALNEAYAEAYNARIDQAVADGNLTQEQADLLKGQYALLNSEGFQTAMQSAFEAAVQQAVADGVISQAQADLILQNSNGKWLGGFGGPGGFGEGRGPGGFGRHGSWGDVPASPAAPESPTTTPSSGL